MTEQTKYTFIKPPEQPQYAFIKPPELGEWQCYMFGNRPGKLGIVYRPHKGYEPNWFVRWAMRVCFDCLWVKDES